MKTRSRIVSWTSHTSSSSPTFSSESTAIFRGLRALLRWGPHNVLYSWGGRGTTTTLVALVWFTRQTYCLNLTVPLRTDNQHVGDNFREMWLPALTYTKLVYLVSSHRLTDNKIDRIKDTRSTTVQKCSAWRCTAALLKLLVRYGWELTSLQRSLESKHKTSFTSITTGAV